MRADGISGIGKWQKEYRKNENPQERQVRIRLFLWIFVDFVGDVQVYRKTIIIGCLFFFFIYNGQKGKNGKYTDTVYTLT